MKKVDFDDFADDYGQIMAKQLHFFAPGRDYFSEYKVRIVKKFLNHAPSTILEFGCGIGANIKYLLAYFPDSKISGCDVSAKSLSIASQKYPAVSFILFNADKHSINHQFDLILVANVFHHIAPEQRPSTMLTLKNSLAPGGNLFIFEHNPYNPVTRHLVNTCPFDADAHLLRPKETASLLNKSGFTIIRKEFILFFPAALQVLRPLEHYLGILPLGGQYVFQARV